MEEVQFKATADVVWAVLKPWLDLHFGEKCPVYEFGCENCERWRMAERMLSYELDSPASLEKQIAELTEALEYRVWLLGKLTSSQNRLWRYRWSNKPGDGIGTVYHQTINGVIQGVQSTDNPIGPFVGRTMEEFQNCRSHARWPHSDDELVNVTRKREVRALAKEFSENTSADYSESSEKS